MTNAILSFILIKSISFVSFPIEMDYETIYKNMKPTEYTYADGSANVYKITPDSLEYIPMTKERSSSGTYSGGDPYKKAITPAQYGKIKAAIEKIIAAKNIHIKDRIMTSGMIAIKEDKKKEKIIIFRSSPEKDELEKILKEV